MTAEIVSPAKKSADRGRELSPEQAAAAAMVAEARSFLSGSLWWYRHSSS
jgi:putative transposase